ncbi:MAG: DUF899 family protein [Rhizobiales bacterium]|nr:DUF899 family protein [Hyphomicrobiales bacterium]
MPHDQITQPGLVPATALAARNDHRVRNESDAYRRARQALLAEEIELRRQIERVAALRRDLPPGGIVDRDYRFDGELGPVDFAGLFGDKQTLVVYSYMYGPQRKRPCPMCTSLMSAWDGEAQDVEQRVALAMIARSPIERLWAFKQERGWKGLKLYSDISGDYTRDYVDPAVKAGTGARLRAGIVRGGLGRPFRYRPAPFLGHDENVSFGMVRNVHSEGLRKGRMRLRQTGRRKLVRR